jgi:hypothetical protein
LATGVTLLPRKGRERYSSLGDIAGGVGIRLGAGL